MRRASVITGMVERRTRLGTSLAVPLCDGATAVPAVLPFDSRAHVTFWSERMHRYAVTSVCCGPEAPLPGKYEEIVGQVRGERSFIIREHTLDGRVRTWSRAYLPHEVEAVGLETLWHGMRAAYARQTGVKR